MATIKMTLIKSHWPHPLHHIDNNILMNKSKCTPSDFKKIQPIKFGGHIRHSIILNCQRPCVSRTRTRSSCHISSYQIKVVNIGLHTIKVRGRLLQPLPRTKSLNVTSSTIMKCQLHSHRLLLSITLSLIKCNSTQNLITLVR